MREKLRELEGVGATAASAETGIGAEVASPSRDEATGPQQPSAAARWRGWFSSRAGRSTPRPCRTR